MKKNILVGLICTSLMMSMIGCADKKDCSKNEIATQETEINEDLQENPFNIDENCDNKVYEYGWGIKNYDSNNRKIELEDNAKELELEIEFDNSGNELNLGMIFVLDGVVQNYTLNGSKGELVECKIEKGKKKSYTYKLNLNYGCKGSSHELLVGSIAEPNFRCSDKINNMGSYGNMSPFLAYEVKTNVNNVKNNNSIECKNYAKMDKHKEGVCYNFNIDSQVIDDVSKLSLELNGEEYQNYRLSVILNNKVIELENGKTQMDVSIPSHKKAILDLGFIKDLDYEDYSNLFVVLAPYNNGKYNSDDMLDKTKTLSIRKR